MSPARETELRRIADLFEREQVEAREYGVEDAFGDIRTGFRDLFAEIDRLREGGTPTVALGNAGWET